MELSELLEIIRKGPDAIAHEINSAGPVVQREYRALCETAFDDGAIVYVFSYKTVVAHVRMTDAEFTEECSRREARVSSPMPEVRATAITNARATLDSLKTSVDNRRLGAVLSGNEAARAMDAVLVLVASNFALDEPDISIHKRDSSHGRLKVFRVF